MNDLIQQEIFEMEVLAWLKNMGFLRNMIFGGGTMLRLCYGLKRYSVDLDFWTYRIDKIDHFITYHSLLITVFIYSILFSNT